MRTLTLAETKARLSAVVDQVVAGEEVVITRRGRPVARIIAEREQPVADALGTIDALREFVLSQPLRSHPATDVVREVRDVTRF